MHKQHEVQGARKLGRRRGTHSVRCKNPNPEHKRDVSYKKLPGAFGRVYRIAQQKDTAKHPHFIQHRFAMGRQRGFRIERANLIRAFICAVLDCLDLATGMTTKSLEQIAQDLNVTESRISRVVNEVFVLTGLMYVHADKEALDRDPNFGMVWDAAHGLWFPKMLVVTDLFFKVAGADDKLLQMIQQQADEHLQLCKHGLSKPGEVISRHEARNRRRKFAFERSWNRRKDAARVQRTRAKVLNIDSLDERQYFIGVKLMKDRPSYYESQPLSVLEADIWQVLHKHKAATKPPGSDRSH